MRRPTATGILAVLRGTAANQDGRTINIHTVAVRAGRGLSGGVGRGGVEAPSTPIGDPFEYASLAEVYGTEGPCALASVNTNFGHSAINYFFRVNWLTSM
jgi:acyl transferase domain-containing protein